MSEIKCRALIVTAKGTGKFHEYDFVSRYFAPHVGINEDPVCASAHCRLIPYWSAKLGKRSLIAYQASKRVGIIDLQNRVLISGTATTTVIKGVVMLAPFNWDEYFMTMAYLVSMKSRDPSTKVGAVIVGPDNEVRATGYNGLPRGVKETEERYLNKEYKYMAVNHAEENAILHCARIGVPTKGCKLYTPWIPCSRCSKSILQAGIVEVIYDNNFPGNHQEQQRGWAESIKISKELMLEAGVVLRPFSGKLVKIEILYHEKIYPIVH